MAVAATPTDRARSRWLPDAPFSSPFGLFRHVAACGISGVITGIVVGGFGGRVFMRIAGAAARDSAQGAITEAGFTVGEVTVVGSVFFIIFVGGFVGIAASLFYLIFQPWLTWAGRLRGLVYGVVLFAIGSATSDVMNPDNIDFFILGNGGLLVGLVVGLFLLFGVMQDALFRLADGHLPREDEGWRNLGVLYVVVFVLGAIAAIPLVLGLFNPQGLCDCETPWVAYGGVFAVLLGTAALWVWSLTRTKSWLQMSAGVLGYAGTVIALAGGLARAVSDARAIINL